MRTASDQRQRFERLCRYITHPAIANQRLSRNGKGQVVLSPLEFMQRLAALVPRTPTGKVQKFLLVEQYGKKTKT